MTGTSLITRTGLALMLLMARTPAVAATDAAGFEDLAKLEGRVIGALDADIGQPGGPVTHLDRRLKLQPCPQTVTIDPPALGAVALRCESLGWRIRVPLVKSANAQAVANQTAVGNTTPAAIYQSSQPMTPALIKRGDPIELVAGDGGFTVSTAAVAQEDGRLGGRIRVKPANGPIVIGMVQDASRVRVSSF